VAVIFQLHDPDKKVGEPMGILFRIAATAVFATGATITITTATARAYDGCANPFASTPKFSGSEIWGEYSVNCSRTVAQATLHGRIKEDRNNLPDVVHDHESVNFTKDARDQVNTTTCQDGDRIYVEAQINNESPSQSAGIIMNC
jgi:hypothetical protein